MTRRGFLVRALRAVIAGTASLPALRAAAAALATSAAPGGGDLDAPEWAVVAAVLDHLLPSEAGAPGARDVHALGYLRLVVDDPKLGPAERALVRAGVVELEAICGEGHGAGFAALDEAQREAALRRLEQSPTGGEWLAEMVDFLMEALLGDPSHGGNPAGIGWQWLGVTPGFPRPPEPRAGGAP
jgi:gluconate 2-dehydrogenase gamma chain